MTDIIIHDGPNTKHHWWLTVVSVLLGLYGLFSLMPAIGALTEHGSHIPHFISIREALFGYVEEHQQFPPAERWCDALVGEDNYYFDKYESNKEKFSWYYNKNIHAHREPPDNMVVAFSSLRHMGLEPCGWNQVGDSEQVKDFERVAVIFGDGTISGFRQKLVPYLRWRYEDDGVIPSPDMTIPNLLINTLLAITVLLILTIFRDSLRMFWLPGLVIGTGSAVVGCFFGIAAEKMFYLLSFRGGYSVAWFGLI